MPSGELGQVRQNADSIATDEKSGWRPKTDLDPEIVTSETTNTSVPQSEPPRNEKRGSP